MFSPVFLALKMAKELKLVTFNVEPYQFKLIATKSDCDQMIFDRQQCLRKYKTTELVKFTGEPLSLFIHYTVTVCRRLVNKCVITSF